MLLHNAPLFHIYFGNARDNLRPDDYLNFSTHTKLLHKKPFEHLKKLMQLKHLLFLKQVHSANGMIVSEQNLDEIVPFNHEGDYLITNVTKIGIGVMTADCLPIVFYDTRNNAVAVVHAGWQGSLNHIVINAIENMQKTYGTDEEHIQVFFGPSAKSCCYRIDNDLVQIIAEYPFAEEVLTQHDDGIHFDLPGFNRFLLENIGIKKEALRLDYNVCTICNDKYFSHRRQRERAGRQMTVVSLK